MIAQGGGFEKGNLVLFVYLNVVFECPDGNPVIGNTRRAAQTAGDLFCPASDFDFGLVE